VRSFVVLLCLALWQPVSAASNLSRPAVQTAWRAKARYRESAQPAVLQKQRMTGEEAIMKLSGPCFLVSTIAGLAHGRPGFLERAFIEHPDGSVTVRFFAKSRATGNYEAVYERVDNAVPRWKNGAAFSTQSRDPEVLWPALLEKAYAKHKGGYEVFVEGGIAGDAMTLLTGRPSESHFVADTSPAALFAHLRKALHEGRAVVAGTYGTDGFRSATSRQRIAETDLRGAMRLLRDQGRPSYAGTGLYAGHAYTVWAVKEEGGRRYVQLRDPMGYKDAVAGAPSTERKSGIFWLPLAQFQVLYEDVHIGG
jgi:hypothetical protein